MNLLVANPSIRVVSTSLGFNWSYIKPTIDSDQSITAQNFAGRAGRVFSNIQKSLATLRPLPVWLTSAGNDGGKNGTFNSPMTSAAIEQANQNILIIESVRNSSAAPGGATRSSFSNIKGHFSAPGSAILSTGDSADINTSYSVKSGTSMATPHVAGLVGYLYTLNPSIPDPTFNSNPMRDLLMRTSIPVGGGAAPRIDAYGAAHEAGDVRTLEMLTDIDDGTVDGNLRWDPDTEADFTDTDADGDGGPGDGRVDMADFRRWRDGYLYVLDPPWLALDGALGHPKKDLNGNGKAFRFDEFVYPFIDLNGDTLVDLTSTAVVPGAVDAAVTDLQVLQQLFDDPHYDVTDLDNLIISADIAIRPKKLDATGPAEIWSSVTAPDDNTTWEERFHSGIEADGEGLWQVYTVPVGDPGEEWEARLVGLGAAGDTLFDIGTSFAVHPGEDHFWDPSPPGDILWQPFRSLDFFLMDTDGSETQQIPGRGRQPRWSPDGEEILAWDASCPGQSQTGVLIWSADGSQCRIVLTDSQDRSHTTSVWSPDASQLLVLSYGGGNAGLFVADVATGSLTPVYDAAATSIYPDYADWSPNGSEIVFVAENSETVDRNWAIHKHLIGSGSKPEPFLDAELSLDDHPRDVAAPRYSRDGTKIAYYRITAAGTNGFAEWALVVADAMTGEDLVVVPLGEGEPFGNGITAPTWSPEDDRIVFPYQDQRPAGTVLLLYIVNADGTGLMELRQGSLSADWRPN